MFKKLSRPSWHSMADEELQREKMKEKRQKILEKKNRKKGIRFLVKGIQPVDLLILGKYRRQNNGSYIKKIDNVHRYHAYVVSIDEIEIHTDVVKTSDKGVWHVATELLVPIEIKRLKKFMPVVVRMKSKYPTQTLRHDLMKKAISRLKNK